MVRQPAHLLVVHIVGRSASRRAAGRHRGRMRVKDAVGRFGERVAAEHLEAAGLVVVARNWRCREGEIDIIARDGAALVFIEVKTRSSDAFGGAAQAVSRAKASRIRTLAVRWLAEHRDTAWPVVRFDVVAITRRSSGLDIEHLRNAF